MHCEGLNHLLFDAPEQAERAFARIDGLHPKLSILEKVRAGLLNYQAETFTALRDMEQACAYLEAAIQVAAAIGSKVRLQDSLAVFRQMWSLWRSERPVQALVDPVMQASSTLMLR